MRVGVSRGRTALWATAVLTLVLFGSDCHAKDPRLVVGSKEWKENNARRAAIQETSKDPAAAAKRKKAIAMGRHAIQMLEKIRKLDQRIERWTKLLEEAKRRGSTLMGAPSKQALEKGIERAKKAREEVIAELKKLNDRFNALMGDTPVYGLAPRPDTALTAGGKGLEGAIKAAALDGKELAGAIESFSPLDLVGGPAKLGAMAIKSLRRALPSASRASSLADDVPDLLGKSAASETKRGAADLLEEVGQGGARTTGKSTPPSLKRFEGTRAERKAAYVAPPRSLDQQLGKQGFRNFKELPEDVKRRAFDISNGKLDPNTLNKKPFRNVNAKDEIDGKLDYRPRQRPLPVTDARGNKLTYEKYDIAPPLPGGKDGRRIVIDNLGRMYYTKDHYTTFRRIK